MAARLFVFAQLHQATSAACSQHRLTGGHVTAQPTQANKKNVIKYLKERLSNNSSHTQHNICASNSMGIYLF